MIEQNNTKKCWKCKDILTTENAGHAALTSNKSSVCKPCNREGSKLWRKQNREKYLECERKCAQKFRAKVDLLKSERPCYDCGGTFPPEALDFHHMFGEKKINVSLIRSNWDALREEMDKCIILCAVCHRIRTTASRKENTEKFFKRDKALIKRLLAS